MLDLGKDLWEGLVQIVMMLGLGKGKNDNVDEEDLRQRSEPRKEEGRNKSPTAFSFSVADYIYQMAMGKALRCQCNRWVLHINLTTIDSATSGGPVISSDIR